MKTWTDDAKAHTQRYLRQVQVLLEGGGADAREVVEDLERHIQEQAQNSPLVVITIDDAKRILAGLGTPEEVAFSWLQMGDTKKDEGCVDPYKGTPPKKQTQSSVRWVFVGVGIVGALLVVPIVLLLFLVGYAFLAHAPSKVSVTAKDTELTAVSANALEMNLLDAADGGHLERVNALLSEGADPNVRDANGMTPLHHAAKNGHNGATEALVKHGADVTIRDKAGKTAADYAREGGHEATLTAILGKPMAEFNSQ